MDGGCENPVGAHASTDSEEVLRLDFELPSSLDSPATARRALTELEGDVDRTVLAKARLAITELVANGVKHADGESIGVKLRAGGGLLRGEVSDGGDGFAPPGEDANLIRTHGWGLVIVRRVSDRWGTRAGGGVVWFEIDGA